MIKDIHRPYWSSLFTIPDQGKLSIERKMEFLQFCFLDDDTINKLADDLEKTASIKN